MRNGRIIKLTIIASLIATFAAGCGSSSCAELDKKKADCKGQSMCEEAIDKAVKAGKDDVCKAALDNMSKQQK